MDDFFVSVVAVPDVLLELKKSTLPADIELGEATPLGALNGALDSPLGSEELRQVLEMIALVFKDGTSILAFVMALKGVLQRSEAPPATLVNSRTGRSIVTVDGRCDPQSIAEKVARDLSL